MEVNSQGHVPAAVPPGNNPSTYWIGDWMGYRDGMDVSEKWKISLPGTQFLTQLFDDGTTV
jgi:hypothetical protein